MGRSMSSMPNTKHREHPDFDWGISIKFSTGFKVYVNTGDFQSAIYTIGAFAGNADKQPLEVELVTISLSPGETKSRMEEFTHWLNLNQVDYEVLW